MKTQKIAIILTVSFVVAGLCGPVHGTGYGDNQPRAMGMAGSYTAMARGVEAIYWNPANLALKDSPKVVLPLNLGFSFTLENNSWSVADYNQYNGTFIDDEGKDDLLGDLEEGSLKFNTDLGLYLPLVGGAAFPMPWGLSSAVALNLRFGAEGEVPRDMIELMLRGNQFGGVREAAGKAPGYDIADWDGEGWGLGVFSWAMAKPWIPGKLAPHVSQFAVGGTIKVLGGGFGEVLRSDGDFETRIEGANINAYGITRSGFGFGFGLDLGAVGVSKDGRTTASLSLVNLLDYINWGHLSLSWIPESLNAPSSLDSRQDSFFVSSDDIRVTSFTGLDDFDQIFNNPREVFVDGRLDTLFRDDLTQMGKSEEEADLIWDNGDAVFHQEKEIASFSKSLPAMLRLGVAHSPFERLTVAGNYDQAFSSSFGIQKTPRISAGLEYRLVDWFPVRFGLTVGGREGRGSAIGFAFGPFTVKRFQMTLLETAASNRGGFFPGVSQGFGFSINLLRMSIKRV